MQFALIELTQGNINNNHLYLSSAMALFPPSAVGGSSDDQRAATQVRVSYGLGEPLSTDIAGDKKIFRKRAWVRDFFRAHRLQAGDFVVIERVGPADFHVYPMRTR